MPNIWEQLAKETGVDGVDSLYQFLLKDFKREFDPYSSVPGPTKNGKLHYLDSVFTESNPWFYDLGELNREDSSYTMFAPTNKAWREMHEKVKTYFVYETKNAFGDSLQDVMAKDFIVRHLVFSNTIQKNPQDSLTSYCISNTNGFCNHKIAEMECKLCAKTVNITSFAVKL